MYIYVYIYMYIKQLCTDTGCKLEDLLIAMDDRNK